MPEYPDVIPMIAYRDGPKAMDWLATAFGFKERTRMTTKEGRLSHGEMEAGNGLIMLATPSPDYEGPKLHREHCEWLEQLIRCHPLLETITGQPGKLTEITVGAYASIPKGLLAELGLAIKA